MKTCLELIKELRNKLRMMGETIYGPYIFRGDNKSVVNCESILE